MHSTADDAGVDVRAAGPLDHDHLISLRAQWRGHQVTSDFAGQFEQWFRSEQHVRWWWLATDRGLPIGMVNLKLFERMPSPGRPPSRWGYLANLFVLDSHRQRGVGSRLLSAVIDRAQQEGLVRVVLSPSQASVPLYARHGFTAADGLLVRALDQD